MKKLRRISLNEQVLDEKEMKQIKGGTYRCWRFEVNSDGYTATLAYFDFYYEDSAYNWTRMWDILGASTGCSYSGGSSSGGVYQA